MGILFLVPVVVRVPLFVTSLFIQIPSLARLVQRNKNSVALRKRTGKKKLVHERSPSSKETLLAAKAVRERHHGHNSAHYYSLVVFSSVDKRPDSFRVSRIRSAGITFAFVCRQCIIRRGDTRTNAD